MSDMSAGAMKARVEEHRKGDLRIVALTADGKPIPNATVRLEQTSHAFRFGCNLFGWSEEESDAQALYRERFRAVHNFATLGFYWSSYEPERGKPRHAHVDKVLEWTESVGIECKGHPLVWNHSASPWYPTDLAELRLLSFYRENAPERVQNFKVAAIAIADAADFSALGSSRPCIGVSRAKRVAVRFT